jgi:hypothetical protein
MLFVLVAMEIAGMVAPYDYPGTAFLLGGSTGLAVGLWADRRFDFRNRLK